MVPKDLQAEVLDTVTLRSADSVDASWAPWWRAQASAVVAVLRKAKPDELSAIARYQARAMAFAEKLEVRA